MKFIDLSLTVRHGPGAAARGQQTHLEYTDHQTGAAQIEAMFGVPKELLRDGEGWAVERFTQLGTHNTTHIDAPWHYNSTIQGKPARTIDRLPLEWFFSDGVVLDMRHKDEGDPMTPEDVEAELARIDYQLKPLDIVLVRTDGDVFIEEADYMFRGRGVTSAATHWLHERGVRVMGIDAWGWDSPLDRQARSALEQQESGVFWAAHQAGLEYSQIERLANLKALPPHGFRVACFPLKIERGSGAPARVVALVP